MSSTIAVMLVWKVNGDESHTLHAFLETSNSL